jgi:RNA polymerase sigma factor FliA
MQATALQMEGEQLIGRHFALVQRIAHYLRPRLPAGLQNEDLVQAGLIGLLQAARSFEPDLGTSFETYAGIRIRGAMLDEVRRQDWVPRSARRLNREMNVAIRAVEHRTARVPRVDEIAAELGVSSAAYHEMVHTIAAGRVVSLDKLLESEGEQLGLFESLDDDPSRVHLHGDFFAAAKVAIGKLPQREQRVLSLYYDEEMSLKKIGEVLGISESRVCQVRWQALSRLRAWLADWE